jgi:hypothetical protein
MRREGTTATGPSRIGRPCAGAIAMTYGASIVGGVPSPDRVLSFSRRACLAGIVLGLTGAPFRRSFGAQQDAADSAALAEEIGRVQATAKQAGLGIFSSSRTTHFLGLGDAPAGFRETALSICESLAKAFLLYFKNKGMKLDFPPRPMTVITLKDDVSYRAFTGDDPGTQVGGLYDPDTNRLVMFDFRSRNAVEGFDPELVNHISLIHETTHLLCFNTGMLSRTADVPVCISEGLATFVELWRPRGKERIGATNTPRLEVLRQARREGQSWIPIPDLFANDKLCEDGKTSLLAYTESWLLVHYFMRRQDQLAKLRSYLAGIPPLAAAQQRLTFAEATLGPLKRLDQELIRYAKQVR